MKFDGTDNYINLRTTGFDAWWTRYGKWQVSPKNEGDAKRIKIVAATAWAAVTKRDIVFKLFKRFFLAAILAALVILLALQSVAIMENRARLDVLEAPPEIVRPDIAIDPLAAESPMIYARHKVSLKYKTRAIYAAHNAEDKDSGQTD